MIPRPAKLAELEAAAGFQKMPRTRIGS